MFEKISQIAERVATNVSRRQLLGRFGGAAITAAVLLAAPATAQTYTAIDLYTLSNSGYPYGVATNGQVVGTGTGAHALLWNAPGGAVTDLHPLSGISSYATGTDGDKQVGLGVFHDIVNSEFDEHAMLWSGTAASAVDLHPTGLSGVRNSFAWGTSGTQQVGYAYFSPPGRAHALLWTGTPNSAVDLHPSGFNESIAYGTDGNRQVGGGTNTSMDPICCTSDVNHALLWSGTASSVVDLHPTNLSGFRDSHVRGINGIQQVGHGSGTATGGFDHALLWNGTANSAVDLHPTNLSGLLNSRAVGTNGIQQVGSYTRGDPEEYTHAMLWSGTANSAIDLHLLLPAGFGKRSYAWSIDSQGAVFGIAYDAAHNAHAVKWVPIPEPSSLLLIVAASIALLARRPQRQAPKCRVIPHRDSSPSIKTG